MQDSEEIPYLPVDTYGGEQFLNKNYKEDDETFEFNTILDLPPNRSDAGRNAFSYEVALQLCGMGMQKYLDKFKEYDISWSTFLELSDEDLVVIGIEDPADRKKISQNLKTLNPSPINAMYRLPRHVEDVAMAKNILNQTLLIDNHIKFLIRRIENSALCDYFITDDIKGSDVLKTVMDKIIVQTDKIYSKIGNSRDNGLISTILQKDKVTLPNALKDKLEKKIKKKRLVLMLLSTIGISALAVLVSNLLRNK